MNRKTIIFLVLATAGIALISTADDPDWATYPTSDAFTSFQTLGTNHVWQGRELSLSVIWFIRSDNWAIAYFVDTTGTVWSARIGHSYAVQNSRTTHLDANSFTQLTNLTQRLPPTETSPPLANLVIVSFSKTNQWTSCLFDSQSLPQQMDEIIGILGDTFEIKNRQMRTEQEPSAVPAEAAGP